MNGERPASRTGVNDVLWMREANCIGVPPGYMFPTESKGVDLDRAKRVCVDCVVRSQCLEFALLHDIEHGVWGGASEQERRQLPHSQSEAS